MDAIILAGVAGTAITADLGARKIREELDALQVLGVDPSVDKLLIARRSSRSLSNVRYAQGRVDGGTDAYAIDWYPSSLAEIATPEARAEAVRDRIEGLFIDGGFRGFEHELERIGPPVLRPAPQT